LRRSPQSAMFAHFRQMTTNLIRFALRFLPPPLHSDRARGP
jgi:hypothetical protein